MPLNLASLPGRRHWTRLGQALARTHEKKPIEGIKPSVPELVGRQVRTCQEIWSRQQLRASASPSLELFSQTLPRICSS